MPALDVAFEVVSRFGLPVGLLVALWRYHVSRTAENERAIQRKDEECAKELEAKDKLIAFKDSEIARLNEARATLLSNTSQHFASLIADHQDVILAASTAIRAMSDKEEDDGR